MNSSGLTMENILCWDGMIEESLHELDHINSWHTDWEGIKNSHKVDSFGRNVD